MRNFLSLQSGLPGFRARLNPDLLPRTCPPSGNRSPLDHPRTLLQFPGANSVETRKINSNLPKKSRGMLRVLSFSRTCLRSRSQFISHQSSPSPFSILSSPFSTSKQQNKDSEDNQNALISLFNRDPTDPPRLLVVQPRLRPRTFLQAKLSEALCLANSLEEQRDGYFDSDFFDKELPPHVVVQNPSLKSSKIRAGM